MKKDELNILADKYYSVMDISDEKKEKRKKDAWELFDLFMLFFLWFKEAEENGVEDTTYFLPRFQNELQDTISKITPIDDYFITYVATMALGIYTATQAHKGKKYFLSEDRAVNLALNESLSINNHIELENAKKGGYKLKRWCTEMDNRVRPTHAVMEGETIPIDEFFIFPDCKGLFPHDVVNMTPEECSGCRCWLEYVKE